MGHLAWVSFQSHANILCDSHKIVDVTYSSEMFDPFTNNFQIVEATNSLNGLIRWISKPVMVSRRRKHKNHTTALDSTHQVTVSDRCSIPLLRISIGINRALMRVVIMTASRVIHSSFVGYCACSLLYVWRPLCRTFFFFFFSPTFFQVNFFSFPGVMLSLRSVSGEGPAGRSWEDGVPYEARALSVLRFGPSRCWLGGASGQ